MAALGLTQSWLSPRRWAVVSGIVVLVALTSLGCWAKMGIRITPQEVLAISHPYLHAVTPLPWATKLLSFKQPDGLVSRGIEVIKPNARATVLYLGGQGFTLDRYGYLVQRSFAGIPVNVVAYDMRGFGRTGGRPDLKKLLSDTVNLYQHTLETSSLPVIVHAHSLGTFVASRLADKVPIPWLILEAPGTTPAAFVSIHLPWWLRKIATVQVEGSVLRTANNILALQKTEADVVLLAGTQDHILPPIFAKELAKAIPVQRRQLILCQGGNHDNMGLLGCFKPAYDDIFKRMSALTVAQTELHAISGKWDGDEASFRVAQAPL